MVNHCIDGEGEDVICWRYLCSHPYVLIVAVALSPTSASGSPWFSGVGDLPGGAGYSDVLGISGDGAVVVGDSTSSSGVSEAFRWTVTGGIVGLGDLSGGSFQSYAAAASADGSVIAGAGNTAEGERAFVWTESSGLVDLGVLTDASQSNAVDVSADGEIVYGNSGTQGGFRWSPQDGILELGAPQRIGIASVSDDGAVVVGVGLEPCCLPVRWNSNGGIVGLNLLEENTDGTVEAVSADGTTAVGYSQNPASPNPLLRNTGVIWLSDGSVTPLPGGGGFFRPFDISRDGSVVVGQSNVGAMIWTGGQYAHPVIEVLGGLGVNADGWQLMATTAVSDDGRTIAGNGLNPQGQQEGWVAYLPEPAACLNASTALAVVLAIRAVRSPARRRRGVVAVG
jgi:probable HAF family extracellular repeat protein